MVSLSITPLRMIALGAALFVLPVAAYAQSAAGKDLTLSEMKVGVPVFGINGNKIGEVNRIKADSAGRVTEVQVTTGGPAGINAEVIAISPDKIATRDMNSLKLSLTASDAKKLPVLDQDQKG